MRSLLLCLSGLLISFSIYGQDYKEIDYTIFIGDCFYNDTISLTINGLNIFDAAIASSDFSIGLTGLSAYQNKTGLVINQESQRTILNRIATTKIISIKLTINNNEYYSNNINLKKGKIIIIDFCNKRNESRIVTKTIHVQQYRKNVEFD